MKNKIISFLIIAVALFVTSCDKEEIGGKLTIDATAPVLTTSLTDNLVIKTSDYSSQFTFEWTPADYGIQTALCNYQLEVDTEAGNFAKPVVLVSTTGMTATMTLKALNAKLNLLDLTMYASNVIKLRVNATAAGSTSHVYSAPKTFHITPIPYKEIYYLCGVGNGPIGKFLMNSAVSGSNYEQYVDCTNQWPNFFIRTNPEETTGQIGLTTDDLTKLSTASGAYNIWWNNTDYTSGYSYTLFKFDSKLMSCTWTVIKQFSICGPAYSDWNSGLDMTYDKVSDTWSVTGNFKVGDFKIVANHDYANKAVSLGKDEINANAVQTGGANLNIATAGSHTITISLKTYPYSINIQ